MRTKNLLRMLLAAIAMSASLAGNASNFYLVSFEVLRDGQPIASPSLVMSESEPASLKIAGVNGFELSAVIRSTSMSEMQLAVFLKTDRGELSPAFMFAPGAVLKFAEGGLELRIKTERNKL
jgi:hypothetical protein